MTIAARNAGAKGHLLSHLRFSTSLNERTLTDGVLGSERCESP